MTSVNLINLFDSFSLAGCCRRHNDPLLPKAEPSNKALRSYAKAVQEVAAELKLPFVDVFAATEAAFSKTPGAQFTINGIHLNEQGDRLLAELLDGALFPAPHPTGAAASDFQRIREAVNDKSWYHLQDYRMLNGWYVYGGRRTWDTETFPTEFRKIRKMVAVRDQYVWDMVNGKLSPKSQTIQAQVKSLFPRQCSELATKVSAKSANKDAGLPNSRRVYCSDESSRGHEGRALRVREGFPELRTQVKLRSTPKADFGWLA